MRRSRACSSSRRAASRRPSRATCSHGRSASGRARRSPPPGLSAAAATTCCRRRSRSATGNAAAACPGVCEPDCRCPEVTELRRRGAPAARRGVRRRATMRSVPGYASRTASVRRRAGTPAVLHAVGPSVLNNATSFGVQIFGDGLRRRRRSSSCPTRRPAPSSRRCRRRGSRRREMTALVPAGHAGAVGHPARAHRQGDQPRRRRSRRRPTSATARPTRPSSPIACTTNADCPPGAGTCVTGDQRLTLFNDLVFLNPNSAAVVPAPYGVCDDGTPLPERRRLRGHRQRRVLAEALRHAAAARRALGLQHRHAAVRRPRRRRVGHPGHSRRRQPVPRRDARRGRRAAGLGGEPLRRLDLDHRSRDRHRARARHRRRARRAGTAPHGDRDRVQPRRHARLPQQREPRRGAGARHRRRPPRRAGARRRRSTSA